jgi:hypothetical protein
MCMYEILYEHVFELFVYFSLGLVGQLATNELENMSRSVSASACRRRGQAPLLYLPS